MAFAACAPRPSVLQPLPFASAPSGHDLVVQIRPLDTRVGGEDRRRYGVDLTAYFSAFAVTIDNRTGRAVAVDLSGSTLQDASGRAWPLLVGEELVRTYRRGAGGAAVFEVIPKASSVFKNEMAQIRAVQLTPATLVAGGTTEGVLLFAPVNERGCERSILHLTGIQMLEAPDAFTFEFPLSACADPARAPGGGPVGGLPRGE